MFTRANKVIKALEDFGFEAFVVGGAVRDFVLGKVPHDVDVATNARPNQTLKVAQADGFKTFASANAMRHGTVTFVVDGEDVEVTTFRFDVSCDGRNATVKFADKLEEDLARRDFTFNAMAMDADGKVVDPFGGKADLEAGVVRFVGDADTRIREDALRMLRAVRFTTRFGFFLDEAAFDAIRRNAVMLRRLSVERVADELMKTLAADTPSRGVVLMRDLHLLEHFLPELLPMVNMEQRGDFHHKDVFDHTLMVLDAMAAQTEDVVLRFAALLHDVGKPATRTFTEGVGFQFIGHEVEGAIQADAICRRLKLSVTDTKMVRRLVREHLRVTQMKDSDASDAAVRRMLRKFADRFKEPAFDCFFDNLVMLTRADMTSHNPAKVAASEARLEALLARVEMLRAETPVKALASPLNGHELLAMGVPAGKAVGDVKAMLTDAVVEGTLGADDKEAARKLVETFLAN